MRISVVTVVWNNLAGFLRTRASVQEQTGVDLEWIVIDGASTDGTAQAVAETPGLAAWLSEPDKGIYDAMNKGLARATGDYVVYMNTDDWFTGPTALARVTAALGTARPGLVFAGTDLRMGEGKVRRYRKPVPPTHKIWHGLPAMHQATLFRRDLHARTPYDISFKVSADYWLVARMLADGADWQVVDLPLASMKMGGDSVSHRHREIHMRDVDLVQRDVLGVPAHLRLFSRLRRRFNQTILKLLDSRLTAALLGRKQGDADAGSAS